MNKIWVIGVIVLWSMAGVWVVQAWVKIGRDLMAWYDYEVKLEETFGPPRPADMCIGDEMEGLVHGVAAGDTADAAAYIAMFGQKIEFFNRTVCKRKCLAMIRSEEEEGLCLGMDGIWRDKTMEGYGVK